MNAIHSLLKTALHENGLLLAPPVQEKLVDYVELMLKWNRVYNLTAITHPRDIVYLHLLDSLIVQPYLHGTRMLDVGSGAGLPGMPLSIINPMQQWSLLDKNSKKTRFLTQAVAELGLNNVRVIHARCEEFHTAQCFDSILSRAFGTLRLFAESTGHLLCPNGKLIAMKGSYPQAEIQDIPEHFQLQDVVRLAIKGTDLERHVVRVFMKIRR